jgi:hypothetical protein
LSRGASGRFQNASSATAFFRSAAVGAASSAAKGSGGSWRPGALAGQCWIVVCR